MVVTPPNGIAIPKALLKRLDQGNLTTMMLVFGVEHPDIGLKYVMHPRMLLTHTRRIVKQGKQITWSKKIKMTISL